VNLTFDADAHVYCLDGEAVPSVTQALHGAGLLPDYSKLDPFYRERGRAVHEAIALDLRRELDEESVDEEVAPFLDRARRWAAEINLRPIWIEGPLGCPIYRYAGTPDVLADSDLGLILPDWKAGQFEPGHRIQVAGGYFPLLERAAMDGRLPLSLNDLQRVRMCVVPLTKDLPVPVWVEHDQHRDMFRAALAIHRWRLAHMRGATNGTRH
jgi:hypothetical protein